MGEFTDDMAGYRVSEDSSANPCAKA